MISILEEKEIIKELFRDVINEVILEERINFYPKIIPIVSDAENDNIEKNYGSPLIIIEVEGFYDEDLLGAVFMGLAISPNNQKVYIAGGQEKKNYVFQLNNYSKIKEISC